MLLLNIKHYCWLILTIILFNCCSSNSTSGPKNESRSFAKIVELLDKAGYDCTNISIDTLFSLEKILKLNIKKKVLNNYYINVASTTNEMHAKNYIIFNYGISLDDECPATLNYEIIQKHSGKVLRKDSQISENHEFKLVLKKDSNLLLKYYLTFCHMDTIFKKELSMSLK